MGNSVTSIGFMVVREDDIELKVSGGWSYGWLRVELDGVAWTGTLTADEEERACRWLAEKEEGMSYARF